MNASQLCYEVQVGKGDKGSYKTRYVFRNLDAAIWYYNSINIGNGYKKRLRDNETGEVIARQFS